MNEPLDREYRFYLAHRDEFVEEFDGRFIAIKNEEVLGVYKDYLEAATAIYPEHEYGTVLVQPVEKDERPAIITSPFVMIK